MSNNIVNATNMKLLNKFTVLKCIRENCVSRADISRITSLTRASITNIVNELIQENLVLEYNFSEPKIGRRAINLTINGTYAYAIGIGISRMSYTINIIDLNCNIVDSYTIPNEGQPKENVLEFFSEKIGFFKNKLGDKIIGIGITSPGPVDSINGNILNPPNLNEWHYFNICQFLSDKFELPAFIEKDINSYALFEKSFGIGKIKKNFVQIFADDGIGSALVLDGELFSGFGQGIEFGHISIDSFTGRKCPCGNTGCIEMYSSIPNILKESKEKGYTFNSWTEIVDSAYDNNPSALEIINRVSSYLSSALTSFLNIFNVYTIVISGELMHKSELLFNKVKHEIGKKTIYKRSNGVKFYNSGSDSYYNKTAGNIVLEKFFTNQI